MPSGHVAQLGQHDVVKSEPEFVFELPSQIRTIGQDFKIVVASDHGGGGVDALGWTTGM